jgi:hypothetical protein
MTFFWYTNFLESRLSRYDMGLINSKTSLAAVEKLTASSFCRYCSFVIVVAENPFFFRSSFSPFPYSTVFFFLRDLILPPVAGLPSCSCDWSSQKLSKKRLLSLSKAVSRLSLSLFLSLSLSLFYHGCWQSDIRIGPEVVQDPAFHVTRCSFFIAKCPSHLIGQKETWGLHHVGGHFQDSSSHPQVQRSSGRLRLAVSCTFMYKFSATQMHPICGMGASLRNARNRQKKPKKKNYSTNNNHRRVLVCKSSGYFIQIGWECRKNISHSTSSYSRSILPAEEDSPIRRAESARPWGSEDSLIRYTQISFHTSGGQ